MRSSRGGVVGMVTRLRGSNPGMVKKFVFKNLKKNLIFFSGDKVTRA